MDLNRDTQQAAAGAWPDLPGPPIPHGPAPATANTAPPAPGPPHQLLLRQVTTAPTRPALKTTSFAPTLPPRHPPHLAASANGLPPHLLMKSTGALSALTPPAPLPKPPSPLPALALPKQIPQMVSSPTSTDMLLTNETLTQETPRHSTPPPGSPPTRDPTATGDGRHTRLLSPVFSPGTGAAAEALLQLQDGTVPRGSRGRLRGDSAGADSALKLLQQQPDPTSPKLPGRLRIKMKLSQDQQAARTAAGSGPLLPATAKPSAAAVARPAAAPKSSADIAVAGGGRPGPLGRRHQGGLPPGVTVPAGAGLQAAAAVLADLASRGPNSGAASGAGGAGGSRHNVILHKDIASLLQRGFVEVPVQAADLFMQRMQLQPAGAARSAAPAAAADNVPIRVVDSATGQLIPNILMRRHSPEPGPASSGLGRRRFRLNGLVAYIRSQPQAVTSMAIALAEGQDGQLMLLWQSGTEDAPADEPAPSESAQPAAPARRGRGRPRKKTKFNFAQAAAAAPEAAEAGQRKRGRPRKHPVPVPAEGAGPSLARPASAQGMRSLGSGRPAKKKARGAPLAPAAPAANAARTSAAPLADGQLLMRKVLTAAQLGNDRIIAPIASALSICQHLGFRPAQPTIWLPLVDAAGQAIPQHVEMRCFATRDPDYRLYGLASYLVASGAAPGDFLCIKAAPAATLELSWEAADGGGGSGNGAGVHVPAPGLSTLGAQLPAAPAPAVNSRSAAQLQMAPAVAAAGQLAPEVPSLPTLPNAVTGAGGIATVGNTTVPAENADAGRFGTELLCVKRVLESHPARLNLSADMADTILRHIGAVAANQQRGYELFFEDLSPLAENPSYQHLDHADDHADDSGSGGSGKGDGVPAATYSITLRMQLEHTRNDNRRWLLYSAAAYIHDHGLVAGDLVTLHLAAGRGLAISCCKADAPEAAGLLAAGVVGGQRRGRL